MTRRRRVRAVRPAREDPKVGGASKHGVPSQANEGVGPEHTAALKALMKDGLLAERVRKFLQDRR